ncbi:hypothetical protein JTE90_018914 [Oedothorax gibbosus]|uniref:Uncharacterized protein n=1 Tax=Oedothorax gibbosus TaxID=931172 RepID=A0AAV6VUA5_9ARAC|nr:hypothetical protein JTE90_018914 [Oedothorax gibbosus]
MHPLVICTQKKRHLSQSQSHSRYPRSKCQTTDNTVPMKLLPAHRGSASEESEYALLLVLKKCAKLASESEVCLPPPMGLHDVVEEHRNSDWCVSDAGIDLSAAAAAALPSAQ